MLYLILSYSETPLQQRCRVRARDLHDDLELYCVSCPIVVLPIFEAYLEVFANAVLPQTGVSLPLPTESQDSC